METRKIPFRNYIILGFVSIITFTLLYCIMSDYSQKKEYADRMNTRMGFLFQIQENELKNYMLDKHDAIIYVSDSTDNTYEVFEKQLKVLLKRENLMKEVVYLDISTNQSFLTNLQDELIDDQLKGQSNIYPNVLIVSNGEISSILYTTDQEKNPKEVIQYIKEKLDNE